jgi:two-component system nitrogen regulation response regulator GlnG
MLRVLQEQQFERLGSNETLQTRVRVLAATNHDLEQLVAEGRFRKDLYYRLKVITIQVPPLRAHLDDVAELAHYFLFRFDRELGLDLRAFAPDTLDLLQRYRWPGNVRELQSAIKQAMLNTSGHVLLPEFLPNDVRFANRQEGWAKGNLPPTFNLPALIDSLLQQGEVDIHEKVINEVERVLLTTVLVHTQGHQTQASELLGLNRATLRHKLRSLGLAVDKTVTGDASQSPPGDA